MKICNDINVNKSSSVKNISSRVIKGKHAHNLNDDSFL